MIANTILSIFDQGRSINQMNVEHDAYLVGYLYQNVY